MSIGVSRVAYQSVSTTAEFEGSNLPHSGRSASKSSPFYPKKNKQYDWKPLPLRLPFLITFAVIFAACIACLEVLVQNSEGAPAMKAPTALEKRMPIPSRQLRQSQATHMQIEKRELIDCTNADDIPAELASIEQRDAAQCQSFSSLYMPYTKNLTYAQQTDLQFWIGVHSSIMMDSASATRTSKACAGQPTTYDGTLRIGCSTTRVSASPTCPPVASIYVANFALTSTVEIRTCTVQDPQVLTLTSAVRSASTVVNSQLLTLTSVSQSPTTTSSDRASSSLMYAPISGSSGVLVTETPDAVVGVGILVASETATPATGARVGESSLPTVTLSNTATTPAAVGQPYTVSELPPTASDMNAGIAIVTDVPPEPQVITVITNTGAVAATAIVYIVGTGEDAVVVTTTQAAVAAAMATYSTINSAGQIQVTTLTQSMVQGTTSLITTTRDSGAVETLAVLVGTAAPVPVTRVSTDVAGQIHTVVSIGNPASTPSTVISTDSLGELHTVVIDQLAATAMYITTDAQGQTYTAVSTAAPQMTTYVSTNSAGEVLTVVAAVPQAAQYNGIMTSLTTYLSTNAAGDVATMVSAVTQSIQVYTYTTTNSNGQPVTMVAPVATSAGFTTTTQYTSLVTTTGTDGRPTSFMAVVEETVILSSSPTQQTSTATQTSIPKVGDSFVLGSSQRIVKGTFRISYYITAIYIPALVAILIRALWEIVFAAVKLVEPFERMVNTAGVDAHYSMFSQYLSSTFSVDTFKSIGHGNLVPLWSATLFLLVNTGPTLAAISMTVDSRSMCLINGEELRCDPVWLLNMPIVRALQGILAVGLAVMVLIVWSSQKSRSGVRSDVSSLSALAQLLTDRSLLRKVEGLRGDVDHSQYEMMLGQYQFRLAHQVDASGNSQYGILGHKPYKSLDLDEADESTAYNRNLLRSKEGYRYEAVEDTMGYHPSFNKTSFYSRTHRNRIMDVLGLSFPLAIFALVLAHYLDKDLDDGYNTFMNSLTLAPKLLLVALGSCSSMHLSHLERSIRITEPFRRLATNIPGKRTASAPIETTLTISRSGTAYSNILQCILLSLTHEWRGGRMIFQTLVSFTVILCDALLIAVTGVPLNRAMTMRSYQLSCYFSIGISSWIILVYLLTIFWWRRNQAVAAIGGMSISKSVGTVGGLMRWLVSGGPEILDMIAGVEEDRKTKRSSRSRPNFWFAKNEVGDWIIGVDGLQARKQKMSRRQTQELPLPVIAESPDMINEPYDQALIPVESDQFLANTPSDRTRWRTNTWHNDTPITGMERAQA